MIQTPIIPSNTRDKLLRSWPDIFPGIDRVVVLYASKGGETGGEELIRHGQKYVSTELITDAFDKRLLKLTSEQAGYVWLTREQLPFESGTTKQRQLEIFSEHKHVVMQLRIKHTTGMDCFYLFFREDQSNFGVTRLQGPLSTARKALLGSLIYRFTRLFYNSNGELRMYIQQFTDVTKKLITNKSKQTCKVIPSLWLKQWTDDYLNELYEQTGISLQLTKEALDHLAGAEDYNIAKKGLEQAAQFAIMMCANDESKEVYIEESYLVLERKQDVASSVNTHIYIPESRKDKAIEILNRLERSASILLDNGEDITSSAVGSKMENPISAPAISDALKKHRREILLLLKENPTKWTIIRQHFKPLINIIDKETELQQIS